MALHSTVLTAWVLLLGAAVPCFGEEAPKQPATPGAGVCKFGPLTLPQSAKADWGFLFR
jgi:hypothetical protein